MKIALIQPCVGRVPGRPYPRTWQMEPLTLAVLAALTPTGNEVQLFDDRLGELDFDQPVDLAALTVETYTARRAYEIASEYRARGVPVVMGGFHPTLCPEEVAGYADSVAVGSGEDIWPQIVEDYRVGRPRRRYVSAGLPARPGLPPDRSIFGDRPYLPVGLVEAGRGCRHACEFCAIGAYYRGASHWRPAGDVAAEMAEVSRRRRLIFLVDDNVGADCDRAAELCRELAGLRVPWISQCSVEAARHEPFVRLLAASGCRGLLLGFESLNPVTLHAMNKSFNARAGAFEAALANLGRHRIRIFGTFVFGYGSDTPDSFDAAVQFARRGAFFAAAFNHLVPFPGTPLYSRLQAEGRLLHDRWWLAPDYTFNTVAFRPAGMSPDELRRRCLSARRKFHSLASIVRRAAGRANRSDPRTLPGYIFSNLLHRLDVGRRDGYPLGDRTWTGRLLRARSTSPDLPVLSAAAAGCSSS